MSIYGDYVAIGQSGDSEGGIVYFNPNAYDWLLQAKRPSNSGGENAYRSKVQPVALLHFSDVHGDATQLQRVMNMADKCADLIDGILCTGDMVWNNWVDGYGFWSTVPGSENVMVAIGNHDVGGGSYSQSEQYNRYMAPAIANWDVAYETGKTYYYKDFAAKELRLIVLNCMLTGDDNTAQLEWFNSTLAGAKTNGYTVVAADHYTLSVSSKVACNYSEMDGLSSTPTLSSSYVSAVGTYIDGGGKFACWLMGHAHFDVILRVSNQLAVVVEATHWGMSNLFNNDQRKEGTKYQDAFNFVVIDTDSTLVKVVRVGANMDRLLRPKNCLTINYSTGEIVTQS